MDRTRSATPRSLLRATVVGAVSLVLSLAPIPQAASSPIGSAELSGILVDAARSRFGVPGLQRHTDLDEVARVHARRMARSNVLFHNPRLAAEVSATGVRWRELGENVGVSTSTRRMHDAFMASRRHRANILDRAYDAIGLGAAVSRTGRLFVVQVFADVTSGAMRPRPPSTKLIVTVVGAGPAVGRAAESSPHPSALSKGRVDLTTVFRGTTSGRAGAREDRP